MIKVNGVASPATNHDKDAKVTIKLAFPGSNVTFETEVVLHRTA